MTDTVLGSHRPSEEEAAALERYNTAREDFDEQLQSLASDNDAVVGNLAECYRATGSTTTHIRDGGPVEKEESLLAAQAVSVVRALYDNYCDRCDDVYQLEELRAFVERVAEFEEAEYRDMPAFVADVCSLVIEARALVGK